MSCGPGARLASPRALWILLALTLPGAPAFAEKPDAEAREWLESVSPIILPQEAKTYAQLKDRAERAEFAKIFWARRDPDIRTPDNEAQQTFLARKAEADRRFAVEGRAGSATGCGRLFVLLGEPDAVRDDAMGVVLGAPANAMTQALSGVGRSSANEFTKLPGRQPQVWVYKNRRDVTFAGGEMKVAVDGRCAVLPVVGANLDRIAASRVVNPGLVYKLAAGRITPLADLLPKPTPAQDLLTSGRQEIGIKVQLAFARAEGATALIGFVRMEGVDTAAPLTLAAHAVDREGRVAAVDERPLRAPVAEGGAALASYRLFLKPGPYTLRSGALDPKGGKGGVISQAIDVPELGGPDLSAAPLLVVKDVVEGAVAPDPSDPMGAFVLGSLRLVPRFANAFARGEAVHFVYGVNGSIDESSGKSDLTVNLSLLKGPRVVAETPRQSFSETHVFTSVGPVELNFEPGAYTARLRVNDNVGHREMITEAAFVVE